MDIFQVHDQLIDDYRAFTTGSVTIHDDRIRDHVQQRLDAADQWPDAYLSLNPHFAPGGTISDLIREQLLHPECEKIFRVGKDQHHSVGRPISLHQHQREAIEAARRGDNYIVTTGTGSGKSLAYLIPIVDWVLRQKEAGTYRPGVKALVVYPMNALANSQLRELTKFLVHGYGPGAEPVTFRRYTGQESEDERTRILADPPDILLTNYMMLELVLTRPRERRPLITASRDLRFLVIDELHAYRGRQGADVALLVRRLRDACGSTHVQCIGTSATMTSKGSQIDQRRDVARAATRLFGAEVYDSRVITETVERATRPVSADGARLARIVDRGRRQLSREEFIADPLAAWVESVFGVEEDPRTKEARRVRVPRTVSEATAALADLTGRSEDACRTAIQSTLQLGAGLTDPATGRPVFAFRIHQFFSKGDSVFVSLEAESERHITTRYQTIVPDDPPRDPPRILVPAHFCRQCGQEYLVVTKVDSPDGRTRFVSRQGREETDEATDGYLFIHSGDMEWPDSVDVAIANQRIPDEWLITGTDGVARVSPTHRDKLPRVLRVTVDGYVVEEGGTKAAFIPGRFMFCLRCGVSYPTRAGDFGKLVSLGAEGRSTATSMLSASVVRSLRHQPGLAREEAKLLAFTDNRQDASLQSGHFNDFVQVTQLRGALHRALEEVDELTHEVIEDRVTRALGLELADFAQTEGARFGFEAAARRALRAVVGYRLYNDLRRDWRVTMPNLEACGLLRIAYLSLDEIAADESLWEKAHPALAADAPGHREELMRVLLDELRRVLAVDAECFSEAGFERVRKLSRDNLRAPWALPENERPPLLGIAVPGTGAKGDPRGYLYLSGFGAFGRYLRRSSSFPNRPPDERLSTTDAQEIISDLLTTLEACGVLTTVKTPRGALGYRIKESSIVWQRGDGTPPDEPLRRIVPSDRGARVDPYFKQLYSELASTLRGLHSREHTAQVRHEHREERERHFADGRLPVLYCSPTMELGIDIPTLSTVGLRNVPPTPANYAQRAGRAGRSGQPALVWTYCATGNSHDQYFFSHRGRLVAGVMEAPRFDLTNEELLRSHVHAIWLAETGLELKPSLADVIDVKGDQPTFELNAEVIEKISNRAAQVQALEHAEAVLGGLIEELEARTSWWHEDWIDQAVEAAPRRLDESCDRWRQLYRAALAEFDEQNKVLRDYSGDRTRRKEAERRRAQAQNQLNLLRNEDTEEAHTDFYSYRYLASEGFLPGYSFPRLPLRAYIPGREAVVRDGEFIQRPRFIAISEFGPRALIYHEGLRYEVRQVQLPPGDSSDGALLTTAARRCEACGYLHDKEVGIDRCESCGGRLGPSQHRLLRLQTVIARRRDRISSDEEERRRAGFDLITSYRFHDHGSRPGRIIADAKTTEGSEFELTYGDSATVRVTNVGYRRRRKENTGYWINTQTGEWIREPTIDADDSGDDDAGERFEHQMRVIPYVEDRRNILVTRFGVRHRLSTEAALTFMYALERGIETAFELEDSELSSELLPDPDGRGRALFIESAEGGTGVLHRLVEDENALAIAARTALTLAHFDPDTGDDLTITPSGERCARACYECLLSYANQTSHQLLDRHLARDLLLACASSTVHPRRPAMEPAEALATLQHELSPHSRAAEFLDWLAKQEHRLPDEAGPALDGYAARPDLVYILPGGTRAAVFVDDEETREAGRDEQAEEELRDAGWNVVRVPRVADFAEVVRRYPSVFGIRRDRS